MAYWIIRPAPEGSAPRTPLIWLIDMVVRRGRRAKPGPGLYDKLAIGALRAKPVVLLDSDAFFSGLCTQLEHGIAQDFDKPTVREFFSVAKDPVAALSEIEAANDSA